MGWFTQHLLKIILLSVNVPIICQNIFNLPQVFTNCCAETYCEKVDLAKQKGQLSICLAIEICMVTYFDAWAGVSFSRSYISSSQYMNFAYRLLTKSKETYKTNQDPCRPWISSTWPSIYSLSIIRNVNQKTSSKANGKLILLRYATHRGKRSSTCVAMVRSSIHVARPTSSLSLVPPALATFSCAFTRKAYELTTHFRLQPNGKA